MDSMRTTVPAVEDLPEAIQRKRGLTAMTHSVCSHNATLSFALVAIAILLFAGTAAAKRNDDTIAMKNGDRFTGEIKKLDHGILYFKSSYMLESV